MVEIEPIVATAASSGHRFSITEYGSGEAIRELAPNCSDAAAFSPTIISKSILVNRPVAHAPARLETLEFRLSPRLIRLEIGKGSCRKQLTRPIEHVPAQLHQFFIQIGVKFPPREQYLAPLEVVEVRFRQVPKNKVPLSKYISFFCISLKKACETQSARAISLNFRGSSIPEHCRQFFNLCTH